MKIDVECKQTVVLLIGFVGVVRHVGGNQCSLEYSALDVQALRNGAARLDRLVGLTDAHLVDRVEYRLGLIGSAVLLEASYSHCLLATANGRA